MYRNLLEGFHVKGLKISKKVEGVALVILESKGEIYNILTLKEKKNKVWKRAGQLAIPMETVEDKETPEEAVKRCLNEEIGIGQQDIGKIINNFKDKGNLQFVVKDGDFYIGIDLQVFYYLGDFFKLINFSNGEVRDVRMRPLSGIFKQFVSDHNSIRPGTIEAILKALDPLYTAHSGIIENGIYRASPEDLKRIIREKYGISSY